MYNKNYIKWQLRRGMLENDLILNNFLNIKDNNIYIKKINFLLKLIKLNDYKLFLILIKKNI